MTVLIPRFSRACRRTWRTMPVERREKAAFCAAIFFSRVAIESAWAARRTVLAYDLDDAATVGLETGTKSHHSVGWARRQSRALKAALTKERLTHALSSRASSFARPCQTRRRT